MSRHLPHSALEKCGRRLYNWLLSQSQKFVSAGSRLLTQLVMAAISAAGSMPPMGGMGDVVLLIRCTSRLFAASPGITTGRGLGELPACRFSQVVRLKPREAPWQPVHTLLKTGCTSQA